MEVSECTVCAREWAEGEDESIGGGVGVEFDGKGEGPGGERREHGEQRNRK